ncbi:hypothetical protein [Peribacillus simplex]|uniref:hypothetical protein n=1 Tax=Peribacillus simplex TaxID=1478 RepID=UPI0024C05C04|nr:hypothetical protein [Peribacillus simplex]WHY95404.1 hypothetical protein QNH37_15415 [Peribacillus simplex]
MINLDRFIDLASKLNIYDRHIYMDGKTLHGSATLNKQISTSEGLGHFYGEFEVLKVILGYSDYYWEEIERFDESDIFLNFDRAGVGNEKREIVRGLTYLHNCPEMRLIVENAYDIINSDQDKGKFQKELQNILNSNFILDGKIFNFPVKEVW